MCFKTILSKVVSDSLNLSAKYHGRCLVVWRALEQACEEDLNIFNSSPVMGEYR